MDRIEQGARRRIRASTSQQEQSFEAIKKGRPYEAEFDEERQRARIVIEATQSPAAVARQSAAVGGPERIWGTTVDFVGVAFLEQGVTAARAVGRVAWTDGRGQGTGFLVAPGLFLTNNHVLGSHSEASQFVVEFDYEVDALGRRREPTTFEFAPSEFFITDDTNDLDYTLIAIGRRLSGSGALDGFGYNPISAAETKHALGEVANIVQHPDGRLKEVALRENRLVSRLSHVLHYVADTEPGSSGSPVFNNQWQAIALHHWGGPWRQTRDDQGVAVPRFVNEGIRISAIVEELRTRGDELSPPQRVRLDAALHVGERSRGTPQSTASRSGSDQPKVVIRPDGTAVWTMPIEIAVGIPHLGRTNTPAATTDPGVLPSRALGAQPEAFRRRLDRQYENRRGYRAQFLPGFEIPLPGLSGELRARVAKNLEAEAGDDPFEFTYQHFSVYVDRTRGLPLVTACNIDGKSLKSINRKTGRVSDAESIDADARPEAREKWFDDRRIQPDECGNDALYTSQRVSAGPNRLGRIFHRGHMVRRLDPCWGSKANALRAEADTFHFTNCTPQVGRFNSGRTLWQGIENHVLDNARDDDIRVSVLTGTVLNDEDPPYRQDIFPGFKVPLRFWKIALWQTDGELSALAMLADQSDSLQELPEGAEAIDDDEGVRDFVTTVPYIEELTGLDFGAVVRAADLYEFTVGPENVIGAAPVEVSSWSQLPLDRPSKNPTNAPSRGSRARRK